MSNILDWLRSTNGRILILIAIVLTTVVIVWQQNAASLTTHPGMSEKDIPATGYAENDTHGKILGNPQNGIDDLKKLYPIIKTYREKSRGACKMFVPRFNVHIYTPDIHEDAIKHPEVYGLRNKDEADLLFRNPDTKYESTIGGVENLMRYAMPCDRLDGTFVGDPKPAGTRDVLAYTDTYYYQNYRVFKGERSTYNPVGFYLVLWDDGEVAKVPYYDTFFAPRIVGNGWAVAFAGQAGLPKGTLTYDQWYQKRGMKRGPRGSENSSGESPDSLVAAKP